MVSRIYFIQLSHHIFWCSACTKNGDWVIQVCSRLESLSTSLHLQCGKRALGQEWKCEDLWGGLCGILTRWQQRRTHRWIKRIRTWLGCGDEVNMIERRKTSDLDVAKQKDKQGARLGALALCLLSLRHPSRHYWGNHSLFRSGEQKRAWVGNGDLGVIGG